MNRAPLLLAIFLSLSAISSFVGAQVGPAGNTNPNPAIDPDCGSISSNPPADPENYINCWISRNAERAVAIHVYTENSQLKAKLRQYAWDGESYGSTTTTIKKGAETLISTAVIPVSLVAEPSTKYTGLYKMVLSVTSGGTVTDYDIGYVNFFRGKKGRAASKVSVTLTTKNGGTTVTPSAGNPCDEPFIDDIGEEEEIVKSPTIANAPTNFVAPIPACAN